MTRDRLRIAVVALSLLATGACAPRIVTKISTSPDDVKLVYNRTTVFSATTGIVQCDLDKVGELENCRDIEICYWNEKKQECREAR